MSDVTDLAEADRALKAKHRTMWALGDSLPLPPRSSPTWVRSWSMRAI